MGINLGQVFFVHEHSTNAPPKTNMIWIRPLNVMLGTYEFLKWNGAAWTIFEPVIGGVYRGVWSDLVTYRHYDIVRHNASLYHCKVDNLNKQPNENNTEWELMLSETSSASLNPVQINLVATDRIIITHNLGRLPIGVMVYDNTGNAVICALQANESTLTVEFSQPFTGKVLFI